MTEIHGQIVDLRARGVFPGVVTISSGKIDRIRPADSAPQVYIMPGFVDAHVHIESSMLIPSEFARLAVGHGTVATVSDPHEIANVLGIKGVAFMVENGRKVPLKFWFGAPSCVPATTFESAGAELDASDMATLFDQYHLGYLSEVMNYPGVIARDPSVMAKITEARKRNLPVDGHAPGVSGGDLEKYVSGGISTDHESRSAEEAEEKLKLGMKILIREGSAARNFKALIPLLPKYPESIMFCSDDLHPDMLVKGHINRLVRRAIAEGYDRYEVLRAACLHPVEHYRLPVGTLRPGDPADFILVKDLEKFEVLETWIDGESVFDRGQVRFDRVDIDPPNLFSADAISAGDLKVEARGENIRVIDLHDGELVTGEKEVPARIEDGSVQTDLRKDILKLVVVNRYQKAAPAVAFVHGFGLKSGALASSVAHDSHNVIAVGTTDRDLATAINRVIKEKGGIAFSDKGDTNSVALPVAGLMSHQPGEKVAAEYAGLENMAKKKGSTLGAPFMMLSFLALLVIPQLKLSDKGLFDGNRFSYTDLFCG